MAYSYTSPSGNGILYDGIMGYLDGPTEEPETVTSRFKGGIMAPATSIRPEARPTAEAAPEGPSVSSSDIVNRLISSLSDYTDDPEALADAVIGKPADTEATREVALAEYEALPPAPTMAPLSTPTMPSVPASQTEAAIPTAVEEPVEEPSAPTAVEEPVVETTTSNFATIIRNGNSTTILTTTPLTQGFESLTESEGTDIHLDGRGFVTLPHGIVPEKNSVRKADGSAFDPTGSHGLTSADLAGVDYSNATKYGISRASYDSDEDWAKAVYAEFGQRTSTKYGSGFNDLTEEAKQAAYDMAWNAGIGAAGWSSVKTMLQEASKDDSEQTTDNLIGFTTNFRSGTEPDSGLKNYPRGLLKRRLQTYNLVAKEGETASTITTTAVMEEGRRTGTRYEIKTADGTTLKAWEKPDTNEKLGDLTVE